MMIIETRSAAWQSVKLPLSQHLIGFLERVYSTFSSAKVRVVMYVLKDLHCDMYMYNVLYNVDTVHFLPLYLRIRLAQ
jgi:hypothetical protein